MQHRRRSSTSDATKFREKLQQLSQSVEMQEHLVTESPGEGEVEGGEGEGGVSSGHHSSGSMGRIKSAWGKSSGNGGGGASSSYKTDSSGGKEEAGGKEGTSRKGVLNLTVTNQGDKGKRDSTTATSVLNVGFDL